MLTTEISQYYTKSWPSIHFVHYKPREHGAVMYTKYSDTSANEGNSFLNHIR